MAVPVIHVDKALTVSEAEHVGGRAMIVGPGDHALNGVAASVIGVGHRWDADRFIRFPDLKVISRMGIGYDNVDVAAARAAGVIVCNAPDSPTVSTAEHAMALLLAVTKTLPAMQRRVRQGDWGNPNPTALELDGATLGLIGLGRIGRRVANAANALGMRVTGYDPMVEDCEGVEICSLDRVIENSHVISLHAPATEATRHIVCADTIARMRPGVFIVNCARGPLIDETALLAALDSGQVAGAGLDVTDPEPPDPSNPLLGRDDVIVSPHVASSTVSGRLRLFSHAFDNALAVLEGRPATVVNDMA